ncbi:MAG TPA: NHL repeat-containing protein, partial [Roseiflexaceae bacterium]
MSDPGFRYLNLENAWPDFTLHGLVRRADGAITLAQVPLAEEVIGSAGAVAGLTGPAGIGVDDEGRLYIADPTGHRVLRWDPCGEIQALPCFGGEGSMPGQLRTPRAVIVGPRDALYVADSGNHRVQVIDLHTLQLRGIWGQPEPYREPAPGDAPNRLNEPWDLAADAAGGIYVLDHGNQRVLKFDADGRVIPAFWETLRDQKPVLLEPIAIATMLIDGQERLIVLDLGLRRVLVVDLDGHLDDSATERWQALLIGDQAAVEPVALAASTEAVYVGDAASGRVLVFDREGHFLGLAQGYQGPLAGLSLDRRGRLLVHTGGAGVVVMRPGRAYVGEGTFVAGPFSAGGQHTAWQQLRVQADPLPPTAHLQLYTYASDDPIPRPDLRAPAARTTIWRPAAPGALAIWLDHPPARYLWIGGVLTGDL